MSHADLQRIEQQKANPRTAALWCALQGFKSCVSFMNTGAHPDDETSAMLAAIGLRDGVKLSHACSTRGEGGQNAIGLEATKDLGVVRTREMERAAEILDISQYWLSSSPDDTIFDFGFSKNGQETLARWDETRTLLRFVQILRRERPDIVCPTFLDVPGQHGHHRAMTASAFKAVQMAADKTAFPELDLDAWQVKKIYLPAWSGAGDSYDDDEPPPPQTTFIDGSGSDPVLGADYAQIAQWSRAFHKTQGMGVWIEPGLKHHWPLNLAWSITQIPKTETGIFDRLPNSLRDLARFANAPELSSMLETAQDELDAAISSWPDQADVTRHAVMALDLIRQARAQCPAIAKNEILHRLDTKDRQIAEVLALAGRVTCRLSLSKYQVRPGENIDLTLHLHAPGLDIKPEIIVPPGWLVSPLHNNLCTLSIPANAKESDPYPDTWFPHKANHFPFVRLNWQQGGQPVSVEIDTETPLRVLPKYSATLSPQKLVLNLSNPRPLSLSVSAISPAGASPSLENKSGWQISSTNDQFSLAPNDSVKPGLYEFALSLDGQQAKSIAGMEHPHTGPLIRTQASIGSVRALNINIPEAKIAYIGGGSERLDHWLKALAMDVTTLDDIDLTQRDFDEFDTILVGNFAFRTRPALSARLLALHDWVRAGGNLVTLYHRPIDNWDVENTPLARLKIGSPSLRWRVTDQNAPVTALLPDHVLLNAPNEITQQDWQGWSKERGLYFASEWDSAYQPLLSMADTGEKQLFGALLSGQFGKGRHTHTSLILHHQAEHLVAGAFRLLANLLNPA